MSIQSISLVWMIYTAYGEGMNTLWFWTVAMENSDRMCNRGMAPARAAGCLLQTMTPPIRDV
jgi:hypothetical protein